MNRYGDSVRTSKRIAVGLSLVSFTLIMGIYGWLVSEIKDAHEELRRCCAPAQEYKVNRSEDHAFVRGYVTAVAELAKDGASRDERQLRRLLAAANIKRATAVTAGSDIDVATLDEVLGKRWLLR